MRIKQLSILLAGLLSAGQVFSANTFTWSLDTSRNSQNYPSINDVNPDNLSGYLTPSNTTLNTNLTHQWMSSIQTGVGKEFTAIYRTRPSTPTYPELPSSEFNPVTFENWAFIRKFINFGGDTDSGAHISAPDPEWVDAAHKNGVKIYGTVYIDSHNGTLTMTKDLVGNYNGGGETIKRNYTVPVLDKLDTLAKKLNLDGWFLNIENGLDSNNVTQLKRVVNNLFPIYLKDGVEFIAYTGEKNQGIHSPKLITDDNIANFDQRKGTDNLTMDNATGIDPKIVNQDYPANSQKTYLLFLDGVFWRNTYQGKFWPMRVAAAKATQCQFFNGKGTWPGFKEYTQAVYPTITPSTDVICGGNPVSKADPIPTAIVKITLPDFVSVTLKSTRESCSGHCFYEFTTDNDNRDTLTFSVPFNRINTAYGLYSPGSYENESLYLQSVPGIKFWNKVSGVEPVNFSWNYSADYFFNGRPYTIKNRPTGGYCVTVTKNNYDCQLPRFFLGAPIIGRYVNNQNTTIPYQKYLPGYQHDQGNVNDSSAGNYGEFPLLNYVMNVRLR